MSTPVVTTLLPALAALVLAAPTSVEVPPLPEISQAQRDASVEQLTTDGAVRDLVLDGTVTDLETTQTSGEETVVALNNDILFAFDSSDVSPAAEARIGELVTGVEENAQVIVSGHTDALGDPDYNLTLSRSRAQAVADVITAARSDLTLTVEGFGDTQPVEPDEIDGEDNPEGRAKNRRVEIRYDS